jgi:hypothetical protein
VWPPPAGRRAQPPGAPAAWVSTRVRARAPPQAPGSPSPCRRAPRCARCRRRRALTTERQLVRVLGPGLLAEQADRKKLAAARIEGAVGEEPRQRADLLRERLVDGSTPTERSAPVQGLPRGSGDLRAHRARSGAAAGHVELCRAPRGILAGRGFESWSQGSLLPQAVSQARHKVGSPRGHKNGAPSSRSAAAGRWPPSTTRSPGREAPPLAGPTRLPDEGAERGARAHE